VENRQKKIKEKIEGEELIEMMQLKGVKQIILDILIKEKGFLPGDIEIDPEFKIRLNDCEATVTIDFVISFTVASFAVIRCVSSAVENWERYVIAFGRAAKDYQIPYAAVTDGEKTRIFDVLTGSLIRESVGQFFTRQEAEELMKNFKKIQCPEKRSEREKRIIYAFEGIKCMPKDNS
jgi:hypothetical protein